METLPFFPYSSMLFHSGTTKTVTNASANELERLWKSFDGGQPIPDPVTTLKMFCISQPIPFQDSMVHAIFDDPWFDFTAYLDWHKS